MGLQRHQNRDGHTNNVGIATSNNHLRRTLNILKRLKGEQKQRGNIPNTKMSNESIINESHSVSTKFLNNKRRNGIPPQKKSGMERVEGKPKQNWYTSIISNKLSKAPFISI